MIAGAIALMENTSASSGVLTWRKEEIRRVGGEREGGEREGEKERREVFEEEGGE